MNTKNLFTAVAVVCLLFGITLAFMPDYMGSQYLTDPTLINPVVRMLGQDYGFCLIAVAVALGYSRNAAPSVARKGLLLFILLSNLFLILVHTMAVLNGIEKATAWLTVVISIVFAVWSGLLLSKENRSLAMG
jgi:hypothetical protein